MTPSSFTPTACGDDANVGSTWYSNRLERYALRNASDGTRDRRQARGICIRCWPGGRTAAPPPSPVRRTLLQGRLRFWCSGEISERTDGEIFYIPAGVEHTFVVIEPARWIAILSPGGLESFFPAVAVQGLEIPRDLAAIKEIAAQFDMEITGPPFTIAEP